MNSSQLRTRAIALLPTVVVGLFAGIAAVAGSYAAAGFTPGFVVAPVEGFLARSMPGAIITFAITVLGNLGQKLSLATAVGLSVAVVAGFTVAGRLLGERLNNRALPVVLTVVGAWGFAVLVTGEVLLALGAGLPAGLVVLVAVGMQLNTSSRISETRREVVGTGLSVLGLGVAGYILGDQRTPTTTGQSLSDSDGGTSLGESSLDSTNVTPGSSTDASAGDVENATEPETEGDGNESEPEPDEGQTAAQRRQQLLSQAESQSFDISGMEPLVSDRFYRVDINAVDPTVDESSWTLSVTGAVENEVTIDYEELRSMPSVDRFETLRCVGEQLNGHKMDTALWTGTPIMDLVERATPQSGCECVMLRAEDDYFEEFPMAALENGLVAYGMNGDVIPRAHGYPARALIPGHWGEINVKWLSEIEILEREADGYWEQRGWHGTGPVNTVAKIHAVNDLDDGRQEVGGHVYAGTRGVQKVEVSTDGGETWNEAELTDPLPGIDVWHQWRYVYEPPGGEHEVVARATDGTGTLQTQEQSDPYPRGPSGWVSKTVR